MRIEWFYDTNREFTSLNESRCYLPIEWFVPSFWAGDWRIDKVPIGMLKCAIPYDVLVRIAEIKKLGLFNCFFAFATSEGVRKDMYTEATPVDFNSMFCKSGEIHPVIVASICHGHKISGNTVYFDGKIKFSHYFIAKW